MTGYHPSENLLKSLQLDILSATFIASAKIFYIDTILKHKNNKD